MKACDLNPSRCEYEDECLRLRVIVATLEELLSVQEEVAAKQTAKLQAAADFLVQIYRALPGALMFMDANGIISSANEGLTALLGYTEKEIVGQPITLVFEAHGAPTFAEIEACDQVWRTERICRTKGGLAIPVLFSATLSHPTGNNPGPRGAICIAYDIRERKKLEMELRHAQKLEAIGNLAAGIAHEINTPTQFVGDNLRFLQDAFSSLKRALGECEGLRAAARSNGLTPGMGEAASERGDMGYLLEQIPEALQEALDGVARISTLVAAMKEFSHPGEREKVALDLNKAIAGTVMVARNEWKYVAEVVTDFDPTLPPVMCLRSEFSQVILNLVVNAAHAIADVVGDGKREKGKIVIQTRNCQDWVEIRIRDSGAGIPENVRDRIFEPFFTTKEVGRGTGQGLAIARSVVVDKHNGSIAFESEVGKGTTFLIRLPQDGKALPNHLRPLGACAART